MENPHFLKNRLFAILRAALYGAVLADGLILLDVVTSWMWKHGHLSKFWNEFLTGIAILEAVPAAIVSGAIGYEGGLVNSYWVNGVLGAAVFGMVAAFWQFLVKNHEK